MNRLEAAVYFLKGDLIGFFKNKPLGMLASAMFIECINHAQGSELDSMIEKCLSLTRTTFMSYLEVDVDYRCRGIAYAQALDVAEAEFHQFGYVNNTTANSTINSKFCYHEWKSYHGLFETDEYCAICNEKRK